MLLCFPLNLWQWTSPGQYILSYRVTQRSLNILFLLTSRGFNGSPCCSDAQVFLQVQLLITDVSCKPSTREGSKTLYFCPLMKWSSESFSTSCKTLRGNYCAGWCLLCCFTLCWYPSKSMSLESSSALAAPFLAPYVDYLSGRGHGFPPLLWRRWVSVILATHSQNSSVRLLIDVDF